MNLFPRLSGEQWDALEKFLRFLHPLRAGDVQWTERQFLANAVREEFVQQILHQRKQQKPEAS